MSEKVENMNISKINSTPFKGTIRVQARYKDSLVKKPRKFDTDDIKKIKNYDSFTIITLKDKYEYFVSQVPYEKIASAYKLAKDTDVEINF